MTAQPQSLFSRISYDRVSSIGYADNKVIPILRVNEIKIESFRNLKNQTVKLGKRITIISGRNATNKTSILGLVAHPYSSEAKDFFNVDLKTTLKQVFKLSLDYDKAKYTYTIKLIDIYGNLIEEPVEIYQQGNRHRVVVSGHNEGEGNFTYNTSFLSLSRLNPMVETKSISEKDFSLTSDEQIQALNFFQQIFPSKDYSTFEGVKDKKRKETFGPGGQERQYDFNSISSGEDNLGALFNKLIGFQRAKSDNTDVGNGVFCIDEMEASLHPSAQTALFEYLLTWSGNNKVQVVFTTHSLHLINYVYNNHKNLLDEKDIIINFLSKSAATNDDKNYPIIQNPHKDIAYQELTLLSTQNNDYKIKIFCEDEYAKIFIESLLDIEILGKLEIITQTNKAQKGNSWATLKQLCTTYSGLITDSIVIFDADVKNINDLQHLSSNIQFCFLPDADGYPIEKRIALYLFNLDGALFSQMFHKPQDLFLSEMARCHINTTQFGINSESNTQKFKSWMNKDTDFRLYISNYAQTLDKSEFQKTIVEYMNNVYKKQGLPIIAE